MDAETGSQAHRSARDDGRGKPRGRLRQRHYLVYAVGECERRPVKGEDAFQGRYDISAGERPTGPRRDGALDPWVDDIVDAQSVAEHGVKDLAHIGVREIERHRSVCLDANPAALGLDGAGEDAVAAIELRLEEGQGSARRRYACVARRNPLAPTRSLRTSNFRRQRGLGGDFLDGLAAAQCGNQSRRKATNQLCGPPRPRRARIQ